MPEIASKLVITQALPSGDGYAWTLASPLGKMLRLAEERFGPRDKDYTILGVEFIEAVPQVWFPENCGNVVVQLGKSCLMEPDRACFQLAHESVHLLSPVAAGNATVLEEGLASHFQVWYMANHYPRDWPRSGHDWTKFECESYAKAKGFVDRLLSIDPDVIKKLRVQQPVLSLITAEELLDACPEAKLDLAANLTQKFKR